MGGPGLTFRRKLFLSTLALTLIPTAIVTVLAMRHLDRSFARWSNRGFERTLAASQTLADSLAAWEGDRLEADPDLTKARADLEVGTGHVRRLELFGPIRKRVLAVEIGLLAISLVLVAVLFARTASVRLTRPIANLVEGTDRVRAGDLEHRIPTDGKGEMGRLLAAWNDMTAGLRENEERIRRFERSAAWGEAARRVAHEIKNPLTPIELSLHRIRSRLPEVAEPVRGPLEESIRAMLEEVEKLRRLAEEFSAFSRLPRPQPKPCEVGTLLRELAALHDAPGVEIVVAADEAAPSARLDDGLIRMALGNLIKNAIEAMGGAGTVSLSASTDGEILRLEVSDRGPGIPADTLGRIFDPYYTTKASGTGIGLALVERVAIDHGGRVSVRNRTGGGACFRIELPAAFRGGGREDSK